MDHDLNGFSDEPGHEIPLICSINSLEERQIYVFDRSLPIMDVLLPGHVKNVPGLRRLLMQRGLREGRLVTRTPQPDGRVIGVFHCTTIVNDVRRGKTQVSYIVHCLFSLESADGIRVGVRKKIDETLRGGDASR